MSLLSPASLERLREGKNLLAFSAGIDSSALFFLLQEAGVVFDIALVDYQTRPASRKESEHAKALAKRYGLRAYLHTTKLPSANFEHEARKVRYAFFEEIIAQEKYDNLVTAHQLNDRLEWFLMQLTKGAGLVEMLGFDEIERREGYHLLRPLISTPRSALLDYLQKEELPYFVDESNADERYRRNSMRKAFATPMIERWSEGIARSFDYLQRDRAALFSLDIQAHAGAFYKLRRSGDSTYDIRQIDRILKASGYLLSAAQREEILRQGEGVVGGRFVVALSEDAIYIAPKVETVMPKKFKEACRLAGIPPKIRPYLYTIGYDPTSKKRS